jgi:asparagine synthase (glutamine-hydrolysing)
MVGIAVVVCWDGDPSAQDLTHRMLDQVPYRGSRRRTVSPKPGICLGMVDNDTAAKSPPPPADTDGSGWCVADVRLDNRDELPAPDRSGGQAAARDSALLAAGYERWGTSLADHLLGDFALALWDQGRGRLYAARDPFGVRPLFYQRSARRLLLASEVEQLLAVGAGGAGLEDSVVLDYLQLRHRHRHETLFRGICRILPGHWHCFGPDGCRAQRYWWPPRHDIRYPRQADYCCEFRRLFRAAVAARLEGGRPLVAQMSGGLDSTAIVCMADQVLRDSATKPPVHVVSCVYPGLDCDETRYVDAVAREIQLPVHRYPGAAPTTFQIPQANASEPNVIPVPRGAESDLGLAIQVAARGILSGLGGDELLFEGGVFTDLAVQGRWLTLLTQTVGTGSFYSVRGGWDFLEEASRRALPAAARRLYRRLRPAEPPPPPPWLGPRLRPLWQRLPSEAQEAVRMRSATVEHTWKSMTSPALMWQTEWEVLRAARQGLEMRFPYLDRQLVDFVLAVPFEQRLPRGRMKVLLRKAMRGVVPRTILARTKLTLFDCLGALDFQINRSDWQVVLHADPWLSAPFVDRKAACEAFNLLDKGDFDCSNSFSLPSLRAIIYLEKWLRSSWNGLIATT